MTRSGLLLAAAITMVPLGANAVVTGSLTTDGVGPFLSLSLSDPAPCAPCTVGPGVGTITGGTVYAGDPLFAEMQTGGAFESRFYAIGPAASQPGLLTFTGGGVGALGFLWGSPDTYNLVTITSNAGPQVFTATDLLFPVTNGDQSFSQYVQFNASLDDAILSVLFSNTVSDLNTFEVANFSVLGAPSAVPLPGALPLFASVLGLGGFFGWKRKRMAAMVAA